MRDQYGLVPPHIKADYERREMVDDQMKKAVSLCAALQAIDPRLDLEFISDRADPEYGIVPGRWHVTRKNDGGPDSFMPITMPDGSYCEPHSGILRDLMERDLWKHGLPNKSVQDEIARQKARDLRDEQRVDDLATDLRAGARVAGEGGLYKRKWGRG